MALDDYRRKRSFGKTPEPRGGTGRRRQGPLRFAVQKHAARRLHYDFRLELGGVLKSWAVPKGPSLDPADKRLAVQVEDHPLEYMDFEGTIPAGEYGSGTVMLWDRGIWQPSGDAAAGYDQGNLKFSLAGRRMKGAWALVRLRGRGHKNWLLIKERDDFARPGGGMALVERFARSVASRRSMAGIAKEPGHVWRSKSKPGAAPARAIVARRAAKPGGREKPSAKASDAPAVETLAGVRLSHPGRLLYPAESITKRDLAAYYLAVATAMLPHLSNRPLTMVRCPQGLAGRCFFQKHPGAYAPTALSRVAIAERAGRHIYLLADDAAALVELVQMGVLEIHLWGSTRQSPGKPDRIVFDLDPDEGLPWDRVAEAAVAVRDHLAAMALESFVKTTGGKGLHVVVPIAPKQDWETIKGFARAVAMAMAQREPQAYTATLSKAARQGKIFIDYLRNQRGATAVAPFSARARPGATVAAPIAWAEIENGGEPPRFTIATLPDRLRRLNRDPWQGFFAVKQRLSAPSRRLGARRA